MAIREPQKWGVDFGNVLIRNFSKAQQAEVMRICAEENYSDKLEKFLLENSTLLPDALYGLKRLIDVNGAENVYIISRVDKEVIEL